MPRARAGVTCPTEPLVATAPSAAAGTAVRTWQHPSEWRRCVAYGPNLTRTTLTALVVGTVLFGINHLPAALRGRASVAAWVGTGLSFVVPFVVANVGLLVATRQPRELARATAASPDGGRPTWCRWREVPRCVLHLPHLGRTSLTALVVGTLYFAVNHLATVVGGHATGATWLASGVTYLVPFAVSNIGIVVGSRRVEGPDLSPGSRIATGS